MYVYLDTHILSVCVCVCVCQAVAATATKLIANKFYTQLAN